MVMRKVRSAPQLAGIELQASAAVSTPVASPRHKQSCLASHGGFRHESHKSAKSAFRRGHGSCSSLRSAASPKHRLQALVLDAPPAPPPLYHTTDIIHEALEQADELIEEFVWSRGLIPAAECFEQFGWTEAAPPLRDSEQPVTEEQRKGLASCLATPFLYDNEHLSRQAQEQINDRSQENNRRLTTRYVEEIGRSQIEEEPERNASSYAGQQALARSRRRRRQEEFILAEQMLSSAPPLSGCTPSPHTQRVLSRTASSLEDNRNKLHMDEAVLAEKKAAALANSSLDVATLESMDNPDQALFSMDDPKPNAHVTPGGSMVVSHDDNSMTAQQETVKIADDSSATHAAVNASDDNSSSGSMSNDENDINGKPGKGVKGAVRGNVVPFARSKVPHSQA